MSNYYTVVQGDTLSKIAKKKGTTVAELVKLNEIPNPNRLTIGQRLALKKEIVLGVQPLFLDKNRDPIKGLTYYLEYAGKSIQGITEKNGLGKKIFTDTADDKVTILIKRLDGTIKEVGTTVSGYGNKLITLISNSVKLEAKTEKHPELNGGRPNPKEKQEPKHDPKEKQKPTQGKEDLGVKTKSTKTDDGKPITIVEGDVPDFSYLSEYNGETMTDADYEGAAKELNVEVEAIKAFAIVESGGGGFFTHEKRKLPKILYERHYFGRLTNNKYSAKYPDISLPVSYYVKNVKYTAADAEYKKKRGIAEDVQFYRQVNKKKDSQDVLDGATTLDEMLKDGKATAEKDKYLYGISNYKRLGKAYQLDKDAALQSCSWGAFQIMGKYWSNMGYDSPAHFVKSISKSEKEQIKAFVLYIKKVSPGIISALKEKNWAEAARLYNGSDYKKYKYDTQLESQYNKLKGIK